MLGFRALLLSLVNVPGLQGETPLVAQSHVQDELDEGTSLVVLDEVENPVVLLQVEKDTFQICWSSITILFRHQMDPGSLSRLLHSAKESWTHRIKGLSVLTRPNCDGL